MLRDVNAENTVKFNSSGLTSEKWNRHQPKPAWYHVATLRHVLRGTRFDREIPSGDPNVWVYRFRSDGSPARDVYAVWCPTSNQTQVSRFSLDLPQLSKATRIALQADSTTGQEAPLPVADGKVTFDVSERPVFVVAQ